MTLKERLKEEPIVLYKDSYNMTNQTAESLEVIADEYAIGFNKWVWGNCFNIFNDRFLYKDDEYSTKELLEIYKKEKGL